MKDWGVPVYVSSFFLAVQNDFEIICASLDWAVFVSFRQVVNVDKEDQRPPFAKLVERHLLILFPVQISSA